MTQRRPGSSLNPSSEEVVLRSISASRSLDSGDQGHFLEVDSAGAVTLTLEDAVPLGWSTAVVRIGTGTVQFAAAPGVTIRSTVGATPSIGNQYGGVTVYHRGGGEFLVQGDVA